MLHKSCAANVCIAAKGTVSPAERCDFVSAKLEKVHELFQVCRIFGKGVVSSDIAQIRPIVPQKSP